MKLTTKRLKQIIKEELQHLHEEDAVGVIDLLKTDYEYGMMLLQDFNGDISGDLGREIAQIIYYKTIGAWNSPEYKELHSAYNYAKGGEFYSEEERAEKRLDNFVKEQQEHIRELAGILNIPFLQLSDLGTGDYTMEKFYELLTKQGLL